MKLKLLHSLSKALQYIQPLNILIVDDVESYFNEDMIKAANSAGYNRITRYYNIDKELLKKIIENPVDIIILDIKGIVNTEIAKDGFDIAKLLYKNTNTFIVITSAHKYKLRNEHREFDYIINSRLLTQVDFIDELYTITGEYLDRKIKFYNKILLRLGYKLGKYTLSKNDIL